MYLPLLFCSRLPNTTATTITSRSIDIETKMPIKLKGLFSLSPVLLN